MLEILFARSGRVYHSDHIGVSCWLLRLLLSSDESSDESGSDSDSTIAGLCAFFGCLALCSSVAAVNSLNRPLSVTAIGGSWIGGFPFFVLV